MLIIYYLMTENTNQSIFIYIMNIWFKTSRSRASNITSTSRTIQEEKILPTITEQRRHFQEADDQQNQSERGRNQSDWQKHSQNSIFHFENQINNNIHFSESVYIPSSRNIKQDFQNSLGYYNEDLSKYKTKQPVETKKQVSFNFSKEKESDQQIERKPYQIYEYSGDEDNNSAIKSHYLGNNQNMKFKHIKNNQITKSKQQLQGSGRQQEILGNNQSKFTFFNSKISNNNSKSDEKLNARRSNVKRIQNSTENHSLSSQKQQKFNIESIMKKKVQLSKNSSKMIHTQRSGYSIKPNQENGIQQNWSALRSRRELTNTKTNSYKPNIREFIISIIEYCSNQVGLAVYNTTNGQIYLCQIIQRLTYLRTISTIERFYPLQIVYSSSLQHTPLIKKLNFRFRNVTFKTFKRIVFDQTKGYRIYSQRGNKEDYNPDNKFIAYSALNALIYYIQNNLQTKFNYNSLSIKWHVIQDLLIIQSQTIRELQIFLNAQSKNKQNCFIQNFSCLTHGGNRMLRANMLQPLSNYKSILERQQLVSILLQDKVLIDILRSEIQKFKCFQIITAKLIQSPRQKNIKSLKVYISTIYTLSHQCLLLKKFHQRIGIYLPKNLPLINKLFSLLNGPKIQEIRRSIDQNFDEQILKTFEGSKPMKRENFMFLFKKQKLQDQFIQILRINYSHTMQQIVNIFKQIKEKGKLDLKLLYNQFRGYYIKSNKKVNLSILSQKIQDDIIQISQKKGSFIFSTTIMVSLNNRLKQSEKKLILQTQKTLKQIISDIQKNLDILFDINYEISVIDMILSFVSFIKKYSSVQFTKPIIQKNSKAMRIQKLKTIWTNQARSKVSTEMNLSIGGSKNVVVFQKQPNSYEQLNLLISIGYLTILTQIGCYVPAKYFATDLYQTILSKLYINQNIQSGLSHFQTQLNSFKGILDNSNHHSSSCLILLDQLVKGTQYQEEISISLALLSHFFKINGKIFILLSDKFQLNIIQKLILFPSFFYLNQYQQTQEEIIKKIKKAVINNQIVQENCPIHFQLIQEGHSIEKSLQDFNFSPHFINSFNSLKVEDQNKVSS